MIRLTRRLLLSAVFLAIAVPYVPTGYALQLVGGLRIHAFELIGILAFLSWTLVLAAGGCTRTSAARIAPLIALAAFVACAAAWGASLYGVRAALYDARSALLYPLGMVSACVLRSPRDLELLLKVAIAGSATFAIVILTELGLGDGPLVSAQAEYLRGTSRLGAANGVAIILILPFVILLKELSRSRRTSTVWIAAYVSALVATLVLGQSRAGLVIVVLGLSLLAVIEQRSRATSLAIAAVAAIVVAAGSLVGTTAADVADRVGVTLSAPLSDSSILTRLFTAGIAIEEIRGSPWIGYGFGGLIIELSSQMKGTILELDNYFVDWSWLTIAHKGGLLAVAIFSWLFVACARRVRGLNDGAEGQRALRSAAVVFLVMLLAASLGNTFLTHGPNVVIVATVLGMLLAWRVPPGGFLVGKVGAFERPNIGA